MAVEASSPGVPRLGRIALRCQPDQRLVALTREGSDAAFEEIVGRYRPRLVAYAARIAPAGRGEDVVQESLMRALLALRRSGDPIELRPWLYRIVHNRALNDLRDQPSHDELREEVDGVPQPAEMAARRADLAAMVAELKSLPDAQRRALVQRELEGRSHEEIANALAVTPGAVRGLIFRARTALRDAVGAVIPLPILRALAQSGAASGGATVVAASAGGGAAKLGVGLTVAVVAVGSGIALEVHRGHHSPPVAEARASHDPAVAIGPPDAAAVVTPRESGGGLADDGGRRGDSGSGGPGPSGSGGPGPGPNSGPGPGGDGGSGTSSGPSPGDLSGEGGSGGSGPSFAGGGSGPGGGATSGSGSSSSGPGGGGTSGSGTGDLTTGTSGSGMTSATSGSSDLSGGSSGSGGLSGSSGSSALSPDGSGSDGGTSGPG